LILRFAFSRQYISHNLLNRVLRKKDWKSSDVHVKEIVMSKRLLASFAAFSLA